MQQHPSIQSHDRKRRILLVEYDAASRDTLVHILQEEYEILTANRGEKALAVLDEHSADLSLVLLDLKLPDMNGMEILRIIRENPEYSGIPVIVLTGDTDAQVDSLGEGAQDFIPMPYPQPRVVTSRVHRTIELSEKRDIIRSTERDPLTGLYNKEFFFRYAAQNDVYYKDEPMDAIVLDINHFRMINERYGKTCGDHVLMQIAKRLQDMVKDSGGIVCRREADTFLVYCPHRTDYAEMLSGASVLININGRNENRVRVRMGVYSEVDKSIDLERRFDRAKHAADTVKNSYTRALAIYDDSLHESELFQEQLLEDFAKAISERQFQVYYQPKFNIQGEEPLLCSAEALVRWKHPHLGMVSPGVFIPLFEHSGLIPELDHYVWQTAAAQVRDWKDRLGLTIPVSVNVSRVDMYETNFVDRMKRVVDSNGLEPRDLLLEITESAYTEDSAQMIGIVKKLREEGFRIEMDDFGSGYSSLNMISSLPIDALKLDMEFIRSAFRDRKDTRLLEVVIQLVDSLEVPTVAEGVETAEQLLALKSMGCDVVQGYYFSRPLPADEFEAYVKEARVTNAEIHKTFSAPKPAARYTYDALHDALTGMYNHTAFEILLKDSDKEHIAVLIVNVNEYDEVKSAAGPKAVEEMILRVSRVLRSGFRSVDDICRLKEDEFVVIMTRMNSHMQGLILDKVERANAILGNPGEGEVPVSLSVGIAFSDRKNPKGSIFEDADEALQRLRQSQGKGCEIY